MHKIILDTSRCITSGELHDVLRDALGFPDYYGGNLDALSDCLATRSDLPPTAVEWRGYDAARAAIGDYVDRVLEIFREAEQEGHGLTLEVARGPS